MQVYKQLYLFVFELFEEGEYPLPGIEGYLAYCRDEREVQQTYETLQQDLAQGMQFVRVEPCPNGYQLAHKFLPNIIRIHEEEQTR